MEGTRGTKNQLHVYCHEKKKTIFFPLNWLPLKTFHALFLHIYNIKVCYFQPYPANNLGYLRIYFSTVQDIQTNRISAKHGRWDWSQLCSEDFYRKIKQDRRNLPKCHDSRKDKYEEHTPKQKRSSPNGSVMHDSAWHSTVIEKQELTFC